jgi:hypothetical protein
MVSMSLRSFNSAMPGGANDSVSSTFFLLVANLSAIAFPRLVF